MKNRLLYLIITLFGVSMLVFNACNKDRNTQPVNNQGDVYWTQEDLEIQNKILTFQNKIKNNNFKSDEQMTLDDAIWNLEALLNFNYSNPDSSFVNLTIDTTFEFSLPVNNDLVNYDDITDATFAMEEHILSFLNHMPSDIKFMIAGDVQIKNGGLKDGSKTVTIITAYGSEYIDNPAAYTPFGENDYWLFGLSYNGGCESNPATTSNAAEQIAYKINNPNYEFDDPYPAGSYVVSVGVEEAWAWDYWNPDDTGYPDNWLDYLMYCELEDNLLTADKCLEPEEMNFYLQGTLDVIETVIEEKQIQYPNDNIEFVYLSLMGEIASYGLEWKYYMHRADITYGKRVMKVTPIE